MALCHCLHGYSVAKKAISEICFSLSLSTIGNFLCPVVLKFCMQFFSVDIFLLIVQGTLWAFLKLISFNSAAKSLQLCPTLRNPIDGRPPGSPIPGILQARTNTGVGRHFLLQCMKVKRESEVTQSCPNSSLLPMKIVSLIISTFISPLFIFYLPTYSLKHLLFRGTCIELFPQYSHLFLFHFFFVFSIFWAVYLWNFYALCFFHHLKKFPRSLSCFLNILFFFLK